MSSWWQQVDTQKAQSQPKKPSQALKNLSSSFKNKKEWVRNIRWWKPRWLHFSLTRLSMLCWLNLVLISANSIHFKDSLFCQAEFINTANNLLINKTYKSHYSTNRVALSLSRLRGGDVRGCPEKSLEGTSHRLSSTTQAFSKPSVAHFCSRSIQFFYLFSKFIFNLLDIHHAQGARWI